MSERVMERLNAALDGRYRLERELGQGGMATVFLAEDVRHDRRVALKVLKPELAAVVGAERFLAEIRTTANLQHPHILPLFDSGSADSFLFYVMPWVEGESLRETLDREKQLSVDDAVEIASKVAGALHYAHEQGVVHRDVKPENILMSRGQPLVADFGIALALSEAGGGRITETGLSLGTPHYMSPEQASGDQALDKRSDVYALGCILYEMLTGEPPYGGPTAQSVLARILTHDAPRVTQLRRAVPVHVDAAVARALEKLPADRFPSADAFARALTETSFRHVPGDSSGATASPSPTTRTLRSRAPLAAALVLAVGLGMIPGFLLRPAALEERPFMTAIHMPADQTFVHVPFGSSFTLSEDGTTLVYAGPAPNLGWQLWVRRADALEARPIPGTAGALTPTLSPAGDAVAFVQGTLLKVVSLGTATTRTATDDVAYLTDWSSAGYIYYISASSNDFFRVPAGGGAAERVAGLSPRPGEPAGATPGWTWGDVLPGDRTGVWTRFPVGSSMEEQTIEFVDLETGESREIASGTAPRYLKSGHLLWGTPEGTILAARFDPRSGELKGPAVPVAEGLGRDASGAVHASVSEAGDVVYRAGSSNRGGMSVIWVDRSGDSTVVDPDWTVLPTAAGNWSGLALSPDGSRVVVTDGTGGGSQLWVKDLHDGTPPYRITFEGTFHVRPRWTPDGREVVYISNPGDPQQPTEVWARSADGSGSARRLFASDMEIEEAVLSADGEWLVYRQGGTTAGRDIYGIRLGTDTTGIPLAATGADEKSPQLSPDGRWLAYVSNETGELEVFVRPFPDVSAGRWQVSVGGGLTPLWARGGSELFYVGMEQGQPTVIAARLELRGSSISVNRREPLFAVTNQYFDQNYTAFDVDLDDQRFLAFSFGSTDGGRVVWVRNWLGEWRRRAGAEER